MRSENAVRKAWTTLFLCAVFGCGGGAGSSVEERLHGDWIAEWGGGIDCVDVVTFDAGYFEWKSVCTLNNGAVGIEFKAGVYEIDGDRISWEYTDSSCPTAAGPLVPARVTFVDGQLRIVWPRGVVLFERPQGSAGGSSAADFGCFDDEGLFEPRAIMPVR